MVNREGGRKNKIKIKYDGEVEEVIDMAPNRTGTYIPIGISIIGSEKYPHSDKNTNKKNLEKVVTGNKAVIDEIISGMDIGLKMIDQLFEIGRRMKKQMDGF